MNTTELLYMTDFDVYECEATVIDAVENEHGTAIILDKTCMYPKGGGQDYDTGTIVAGGREILVSAVFADQNGVVHHYADFELSDIDLGIEVGVRVDQQRRILNTRLHSAGHLIDMAVADLGYGWIPGKGAHYPHMAFVEYEGEWDAEQRDEIIANIESKISQYALEGGENTIEMMSITQMQSVCRHVPENIPTNKPSRVVVYRGNFGVPCGGTHVSNLSDVGTVHITRIKKKSGKIRVSYSIQ